jgi:hypothetical protein
MTAPLIQQQQQRDDVDVIKFYSGQFIWKRKVKMKEGRLKINYRQRLLI